MGNKKNKNSSNDFIDSILGDLAGQETPPSSSNEATALFDNPKDDEVDVEKTMVVGGQRVHGGKVEEKVSFGMAKPSTRSPSSANASAVDAQLSQAENFRIAQQRLTDLEKELEKLRSESELLNSANQIATEKAEEFHRKLETLQRDKAEEIKQYEAELEVFRDNNATKDYEIVNLRRKVQELEGRLRQDLRKIRIRERELENRLEISKMEKDTLLRTKDEAMLELKRKIDQLTFEADNYRHKISELNERVESNHDQMARTVRTLRLALANLETSDPSSLTPIKKAE